MAIAMAAPAQATTKVDACKAAYPTLTSLCVSHNGDPDCKDIPNNLKPVKIVNGNDPAHLDGSDPKNGWGCEDAKHPIPSDPDTGAPPTQSSTAASAGAGQLPVTGSKIPLIVGTGVVLGSVGTVLLILARKRRAEIKFISE